VMQRGRRRMLQGPAAFRGGFRHPGTFWTAWPTREWITQNMLLLGHAVVLP
jgi:hypothetical protein